MTELDAQSVVARAVTQPLSNGELEKTTDAIEVRVYPRDLR